MSNFFSLNQTLISFMYADCGSYRHQVWAYLGSVRGRLPKAEKSKLKAKRRRRYRIDTVYPLRVSSSPFSALSRRRLNTIKPVNDPDRPDGRLNWQPAPLTNWVSIPAVLVAGATATQNSPFFFPSGGRNHRQYSLRLPTEGWPGWVGLGGWLRT